jgi:glyoxylase-like metal-dependent hydrolase (beta-lactamase superfamily II)
LRSENSFLVSAHLIESNGEIAIVDAQMFNDEVDKLIEKAKKTKGTVKTIFITHVHPDHFFGLQRLKAAFPEARLVAPSATVEGVAQAGPGMLKFYREGFRGLRGQQVLPAAAGRWWRRRGWCQARRQEVASPRRSTATLSRRGSPCARPLGLSERYFCSPVKKRCWKRSQ